MAWTTGIHAVETALSQQGDEVAEVWIVKSDNPGAARRRIKRRAEDDGLAVRLVTDDQLRRAVGDVNHQGVAARVDAFSYAEEDAILEHAGEHELLVALDGVQDPHNLGAVIRSACALGAKAVVIPRHRAAGVTAAVRKVSAGAAERLPVCMVTNMAKFLSRAKEGGYWVYGTTVDGGTPLENVSFAERSVLVFGSEANGLRKGVQSQADMEITLEMNEMESLNVSVAAGIFVYAWRRQHLV